MRPTKEILLPTMNVNNTDNNATAYVLNAISSSSEELAASSEDDDEQHLLEHGSGGVSDRQSTQKATGKKEGSSKLKAFVSSCTNRRHHCIHRSVRRLLRLFLCILLLPLFVLLIYMPVIYSNVPTRHVALSDWSFNTSRNIADYVFPDSDTTIIEPNNMCHSNEDKIFILIIVCSGLNNFVARQTIRETWGNLTEFNYTTFAQMHAHLKGQYLEVANERLEYYSDYFESNKNKTTANTTISPITPTVRIVYLLGRSKYESYLGNETLLRLRAESAQYNDIIQQDFIDTYNNLTIKSVLALKWVTQNCLKNVAYVMKCDDDTFVNIPNLLHFLLGGTVPAYNDTIEYYDRITYRTLAPSNRLAAKHNYLTGHLFCTARPIANVSSKWYIPYYMYPEDKYPKYLSGAGYLMSIDVVPRLYETALNTSLIFLEDVYLTGICADKAHLHRTRHPLFSYTLDNAYCSFKGTITQHEVKTDTMLEAYAFVANISNRCRPPEKYFKTSRLNKHSNCK